MAFSLGGVWGWGSPGVAPSCWVQAAGWGCKEDSLRPVPGTPSTDRWTEVQRKNPYPPSAFNPSLPGPTHWAPSSMEQLPDSWQNNGDPACLGPLLGQKMRGAGEP